MVMAARLSGILLALALPCAACDGPTRDARLRSEDCHRLLLRDARTNEEVRGVEDIALGEGVAYLSAYDRRATAAAADRGDRSLPQGGLYRLSLDPAILGRDEAAVTDLALAFKESSDFHPHGIDLLPADEHGPALLAVINRVYERHAGDGSWSMQPRLALFEPRAESLVHKGSVESPELCRANDVAGRSRRQFFVSTDGEACDGWRRWLELAPGFARGQVLRISSAAEDRPMRVETGIRGIAFANGVAVHGNRLHVAATRGGSVETYELGDGSATPEFVRSHAIEGGPDNLSVTPAGGLLVAAHPSLLRLAAYLSSWLPVERTGSRILRLDMGEGSLELLYDDGDGTVFSGATVAVQNNGHLIAGSVADSGLLVCDLRGPSREASGRNGP